MPTPLSTFFQFIKNLKRAPSNKILGGVCQGCANHSQLPAWFYRVLFITLVALFGFGILPYLAMWIFIPKENKTPSA